jgi:hypothetical protein
MPTARNALATGVVNGKIYAVGGQTPVWGEGGGPMLSIVEGHDPATDVWMKRTNMPKARGWSSISVVNGKIYAIGGSPAPPATLLTVEKYDTGFFVEEKDQSIEPKDKLATCWSKLKAGC